MILFVTVRGNVVEGVDDGDDEIVGIRERGVVGDGLIVVGVDVVVNNEAGRGYTDEKYIMKRSESNEQDYGFTRVVIVDVSGAFETDVCGLIVSILFGVVDICCTCCG